VDRAAARTDGVASYGEPEPDSASVRATLLEWTEHSFGSSLRQSTALVAHFDQDLLRRRVDLKHDVAAQAGEFEGVLQ
jgi:hypothetical protein